MICLADLTNASVKILRPAETVSDLQAVHEEQELPPIRCSLRDLSVMGSIGALGRVSVNGYTCRLQTDEPIVPGWRVKVTVDGGDERVFVVVKVDGNLHKRLTLEGA